MTKPPALGQLGLPDQFLNRRDAFHMACVLSYSTVHINPGDYIRYAQGCICMPCDREDADGIVDPFACSEVDRALINPGETFWVMLKPNSISNLTHKFDTNISQLESMGPDEYEDAFREDVDEDDLWGGSDECRGCE